MGKRTIKRSNRIRAGEELGDTQGTGFEGSIVGQGQKQPWRTSTRTRYPARPGEEQHEWEEPRVVGNSSPVRLQQEAKGGSELEAGIDGKKLGKTKAGRQTESELGGADDGLRSGVDPITNRVDRLRLLGNGVVPETAERAIRILLERLHQD